MIDTDLEMNLNQTPLPSSHLACKRRTPLGSTPSQPQPLLPPTIDAAHRPSNGISAPPTDATLNDHPPLMYFLQPESGLVDDVGHLARTAIAREDPVVTVARLACGGVLVSAGLGDKERGKCQTQAVMADKLEPARCLAIVGVLSLLREYAVVGRAQTQSSR